MAAGDLTTVDRLKDYLCLKTVEADTILAQLIRSSSAWVASQIGHEYGSHSVTDTLDGDGTTRMLLLESSVTGVTSVTVGTDVIPKRLTVDGEGWVLSNDGIDLVGYLFTEGIQNVVIVYTAGYRVAGEVGTVPAAAPHTVQAAQHFGGNVAVTYANGTAMANVASSPTVGQYTVNASGLYGFAAADAGAGVLLTYASCPADLEQAVIEHVAFKFRRRTSLGQGSASAGGEAITYSDTAVLAGINDVLDRYRPLVVT